MSSREHTQDDFIKQYRKDVDTLSEYITESIIHEAKDLDYEVEVFLADVLQSVRRKTKEISDHD